MSNVKHAVLDHGGFQSTDGPRMAMKFALPNLIGGGAGQPVVTAFVFADQMPDANYVVFAAPDQDAVCFISAKTRLGFSVNMSPRLAASTLAVGLIDLLITG